MSKATGFASISKPKDIRRFAKAAASFAEANTKTPELAMKVLVEIGAVNSKGELKKASK
jgi:hypothetical protein